jgi:hypothetical protein
VPKGFRGGDGRLVLIVAKIMLMLWVPVTAVLAASYRPALACSLAMLGAILFLPSKVVFDFPGVPPLGRQEITSLSMLVFGLLFHGRRLVGIRPGWGVDSLLFVVLLGGVGTILTNGDVLTYGPRVIPGLQPYDAVSTVVRDVIALGIPFLLGRAFFRTSRDLRTLVLVLIGGALLYTLLILFELRMSPQLHRWVYGFHPQRFLQSMRGSGYRPTVFMGSGLAVAIFIASTLVLSMAMLKARLPIFQFSPRLVVAYLAGILVACKSMASILYGTMGLGVLALFRPRAQTQVASMLAVLSLLYPVARTYDFFPATELVEMASFVSADRAHSLDYRFRNEDLLLAKANERILLGWGGFGRNRVYDPKRGGDRTITDGYWIIQLGTRGILGMLASFGFMVLPVLITNRRIHRIRDARDRALVGALALVLGFMTVDLLPNGLFTYLPLFIGGALLGVIQGLTSPRVLAAQARAAAQHRGAALQPAAIAPELAPARRTSASLAQARHWRRGGS